MWALLLQIFLEEYDSLYLSQNTSVRLCVWESEEVFQQRWLNANTKISVTVEVMKAGQRATMVVAIS